jgi:hypothetical protein
MSTAAPVLTAKLINIDCKPEVSFEILARVEADEHGKPRCKPFPVSRWYAHLGRLVGQTIKLTVTRQKGKRSSQQNKYLWACVYEDYLNGLKERAADVGMVLPFRTKDDLHHHLKAKYIGLPVADFDGEEVHLDPTTTVLTTEQFSLYIEAIKSEAARRGIYIREANKDWQYEEQAA